MTITNEIKWYAFRTDSGHGDLAAHDFAEACIELEKMVEETIEDGGWGWVQDEDGSRFEIGEVTL